MVARSFFIAGGGAAGCSASGTPLSWGAAITTGHIASSGEQSKQWIMPQLLMIVEALIPQSDPHHTLSQQLQRGELHQLRIAMISECPHERLEISKPLIDFPQQQPASVRSDRSAIKSCRNLPSPLSLNMSLKQQH
jgi:hypothetical protein